MGQILSLSEARWFIWQLV